MDPAQYLPKPGVVLPPLTPANFELKASLLNMIRQNLFNGLPSENPHQHIATFKELLDTVKVQGVSPEELLMRSFSFSLSGKAKHWYNSIPAGTITTWDALSSEFLNQFFPPAKTAEMRRKINAFAARDGENIHESWERFKDLLFECPHHGMPKLNLLEIFYKAVDDHTRLLIDSSSGGGFLEMEADDAWAFVEKTAKRCGKYSQPRALSNVKRGAGIYEVDAETYKDARYDSLAAEIKRLASVMEKSLSTKEVSVAGSRPVPCQFCESQDHTISAC